MLRSFSRLRNVRQLSISIVNKNANAPIERQAGPVRVSLDKAVDSYEDFIGIKAVKLAQTDVMHWENKLSEAQMIRREKQAEIKHIQERLKEIHTELDRTARGEDRYLHLLTEEHKIIKEERTLLGQFEGLETAEREAFHQLSNRVRASHERERERAEKTKWWSVSASLIGALLGILGTSIGNELRMRRLKEMLPVGGAHMKEMAQVINEQNEKVTSFLLEMKGALNADGVNVERQQNMVVDTKDVEKLVEQIRSENERLASQMSELSRMARLEHSMSEEGNVVYVGNDMERLLDQTQRNLESKMKLQTLLSVVFLYTAIGVTIPLAFAFFRGN